MLRIYIQNHDMVFFSLESHICGIEYEELFCDWFTQIMFLR
jgi:hypothetical protein